VKASSLVVQEVRAVSPDEDCTTLKVLPKAMPSCLTYIFWEMV